MLHLSVRADLHQAVALHLQFDPSRLQPIIGYFSLPEYNVAQGAPFPYTWGISFLIPGVYDSGVELWNVRAEITHGTSYRKAFEIG